MFASYHIYPYYPDSLNYQLDYLSNIDEDGKIEIKITRATTRQGEQDEDDEDL